MSRKLMGIAIFVWLALLVAGFAPVQYAAAADKYPSRPVDFLVPSGPGGGADQIARMISPLMEKQFKTPFPVSNLPGAGGNAALSKLIASKPDGYSVSIFMGRIVCSWATIGLGEFKIEDFVWLSRLIKQESAFFVNYDSPIKDAQDLFRIAKEKSLKVAIHGHGNLDDISVRYLVSQGFKFVGVPFAKPSERYMAPLGGHVDVLYEEPGDVKSFIDAKQLRPILMFSQKRSKFFPDVPTTYELGYKIGFPNWRGIVVKSGTPPEIVKSLEEALKKMTETPEWQKYLADEMAEPDSFLGPAAFQPSVYEEFKLLDAFAKQYGIK